MLNQSKKKKWKCKPKKFCCSKEVEIKSRKNVKNDHLLPKFLYYIDENQTVSLLKKLFLSRILYSTALGVNFKRTENLDKPKSVESIF